MKRSALTRHSGMSRRSRLKTTIRPVNRTDPARVAWKQPHGGWCECGCNPPTFALHLERHHIVPLSLLRQMNRLDAAWDLRNSMLLAPQHHAWHTTCLRKIPVQFVPRCAVDFANEVLGEDRAILFFLRAYAREVPGSDNPRWMS